MARIELSQFHPEPTTRDLQLPDDTTHIGRAYHSVPPGADFVGYEEYPDHLMVIYKFPSVRKLNRHRVNL
jgi:hypothetical protein